MSNVSVDPSEIGHEVMTRPGRWSEKKNESSFRPRRIWFLEETRHLLAVERCHVVNDEFFEFHRPRRSSPFASMPRRKSGALSHSGRGLIRARSSSAMYLASYTVRTQPSAVQGSIVGFLWDPSSAASLVLQIPFADWAFLSFLANAMCSRSPRLDRAQGFKPEGGGKEYRTAMIYEHNDLGLLTVTTSSLRKNQIEIEKRRVQGIT